MGKKRIVIKPDLAIGAEALVEKEVLAETTKKKKIPKPARKRGKRYLQARKLVNHQQAYSLTKAIKLLKKTSISRFNGSVEVHLSTHQTGLQTKIKFPHSTEKKAPLIHLVIGKVDDPEKNLSKNFLALIKAIGPNNIKKAVLTSTMGPGIKVAIDKLDF